jgi:hypothetical protein
VVVYFIGTLILEMGFVVSFLWFCCK